MRSFLIAVAAFAVLSGLWLAVPGLMARGDAESGAGKIAARLAWFRSDLWARGATTVANAATGGAVLETPAAANLKAHAARRALRRSPLRSDLWLALAGAPGSDAAATEAAITMAFFTGPGQRADVPARLRRAAQVLDLHRPDLCDMLRPDIGFELKQGAAGATIVAAAKRNVPDANAACVDRLTHDIASLG